MATYRPPPNDTELLVAGFLIVVACILAMLFMTAAVNVLPSLQW